MENTISFTIKNIKSMTSVDLVCKQLEKEIKELVAKAECTRDYELDFEIDCKRLELIKLRDFEIKND